MTHHLRKKKIYTFYFLSSKMYIFFSKKCPTFYKKNVIIKNQPFSYQETGLDEHNCLPLIWDLLSSFKKYPAVPHFKILTERKGTMVNHHFNYLVFKSHGFFDLLKQVFIRSGSPIFYFFLVFIQFSHRMLVKTGQFLHLKNAWSHIQHHFIFTS